MIYSLVAIINKFSCGNMGTYWQRNVFIDQYSLFFSTHRQKAQSERF